MRFRLATFAISMSLAASMLLGQVGNGTITGLVTDPAGAVIAGATVQAKNANTGVVYTGASTAAGVYTISDLPVGTYTVTSTVMGFKAYTHTGLVVEATGTLRENISLQVGASTESVTVTAEASLLKTESGELASNVTIDTMDQLPLLGVGTANAGTSGYRNPYNTILTLPGVGSYTVGQPITINGLGQAFVTTETMRIEGQDASSRLIGNYDYTQIAQPGVDSIQEIAYQTSNYAPEFGQAGSVVINMTMKSGTNQFHGSLYDNFVNEDLNAGDPFSVNADGVGKVRPRNRRNDFGGTLGGPVYIPKIYNGHNKTFFFWSYEQYLENVTYTNFTDTVPTAAYLQGNFSAISPNGNCSACAALGVPTGPLGFPTEQLDARGNPMYANEIYDPLSRGTLANGLQYASPFQNNEVPLTRVDPVYEAIVSLSIFPKATNNNYTDNYNPTIGGHRYSAIPSMKIDHNIDAKDKLSFYYSENNTQSQVAEPYGNVDGLPLELGQYRGTFIPTYTERLNYDRTITPTLLLHLGAGYLHTSFSDHAAFLDFDPSQFGLSDFQHDRQFPTITGMCVGSFFAPGCTNSTGGMQSIGTADQIQSISYEEKPSFIGNMTWVHGAHTFKFGSELYLEQDIAIPFSGVTLTTGTGPTSEPFAPSVSFNGLSTGFGYASWMLGDYSSTSQTAQTDTRAGQQVWGFYAQDSWKVTRKLTVDYGLRYDYDTPFKEQYGRWGQFAPDVPNALAGGHPGSTVYANNCNCNFYQNAYPFAFGPRIGVAYQIDPKTVLRAGWGYVYQFSGYDAGGVISTPGTNSPTGVPTGAFGVTSQVVNTQSPGFIVLPTWPVEQNVYPEEGTLTGAPLAPDKNINRPPRIDQFSLGIQREITRNTVLEASFVGNRAAWLISFPTSTYGLLDQVSPAMYASVGLYPYPGTGPSGYNLSNPALGCQAGNDCARALLGQTITSPFVTQYFGHVPYPYATAPGNMTLAQALQAFPQYPGLGVSDSPTSDSMYNSLQVKLTKRFSHGLQAGGTYTFQKGFTRAIPQDFWNPTSSLWDVQNIPFQVLNFNFIYTTPSTHYFSKWVNLITKDWQVGGYADYQTGTLLTPPSSTTSNFLTSEDVYTGASFYNQGVNPNNLSTYNPYYTQLLNPSAWKQCPTNTTCTAPGTLYPGFRAPRTPIEDANFGRNFRIKERMNLYIRAEFVNIFNRTLMPAPSTTNPQLPISYLPNGIISSGFGTISAYAAPGNAPAAAPPAVFLTPRTGTLIARFSF